MKLNSNHKKTSSAPAKAGKETKESKESKDVKKHAHEEAVALELPVVKGKAGRKNKVNGTQLGEITNPAEEPAKLGRLGLIKTRHEAMKREIDQIREDLESEEEE